METLKISARTENDIVVVDIDGALKGGPESNRLHTLVREHLDAGRSKILLNFSEVPWINSFGLGVVASCLVTSRRSKADLRMYGLNKRTTLTFAITGLVPAVFELLADEATAIASFENPS